METKVKQGLVIDGRWFSHSVTFDSHNPMDCSPLGSSAHGILQAKILEWVAIFFSRVSSRPKNRTQLSCIAGRFFYQLRHEGSTFKSEVKVLVAQSCLTLCNPMDYSLPGSSIHGILQARKNTGVGCHSLLQGIFPT